MQIYWGVDGIRQGVGSSTILPKNRESITCPKPSFIRGQQQILDLFFSETFVLVRICTHATHEGFRGFYLAAQPSYGS